MSGGGHERDETGGVSRRSTVVFVHAHPDDEAIFTGGTMTRLAAAGHRVVLVVATGGELGESPEGPVGPKDAGGQRDTARLAERRRRETHAAARLLGVARVELLDYHDSGMAGDAANADPASFWSADVEVAAKTVATVLEDEGATAAVGYDEFGIYGHPDHVQVHRVTRRAAEMAGVPTVYDATVDREYLHFVETHLVEEAVLDGGTENSRLLSRRQSRREVERRGLSALGAYGAGPLRPQAGDLGLVRSHIGMPTVAIATTVDVRQVLATKRAAMAAHASQIPESTSALQLPEDRFADVYGWEWYVRTGPPGPLDDL